MEKNQHQYPGVRDGMYRREVINEIIRIFLGVESFMKSQWKVEMGQETVQIFASQNNGCEVNNEKQSAIKSPHF